MSWNDFISSFLYVPPFLAFRLLGIRAVGWLAAVVVVVAVTGIQPLAALSHASLSHCWYLCCCLPRVHLSSYIIDLYF